MEQFFGAVLLVAAFAQNPDALFQSRCAQCHNMNNSVGAPLPETLRQMPWQAILTALESGKMKGVGEALTAAERDSIAKHLGKGASDALALTANCSAGAQPRTGGGD